MQDEYKNQNQNINNDIQQNNNNTNQNNIEEKRQYTPKDFNNIPPKERNYERINSKENNQIMKNDLIENNYQKTPPNYNDNRSIPPRDINYQQNYGNYRRTPYGNNDYRRMTPSVHNYKYNRNEDYNQMPPDHYSEPGRYQDNRNDFNRQYNYMGNKTPNNCEDYKNQDYNNQKMMYNDYHPLSNDGRYNERNSPYQRPDYYENNRPRTMDNFK